MEYDPLAAFYKVATKRSPDKPVVRVSEGRSSAAADYDFALDTTDSF